MIDIRQTHVYAKYLKKNNWQIKRINEVNYFIKKLPLIGSVVKIQRPEEINLKNIKILSARYRAFQIIIEPKNRLDAQYLTTIGFKKSQKPYLPTKTLHLNLTNSQKDLIEQMKKDARLAIRKNTQLSIANLQTENLEKFRKAWRSAVGLKRYVPPIKNLKSLKKSFRKNCLFLLTKDGSAGAIFLMGDKIAYYWQAFSNQKARQTLVQYKIVWEGILWAKKRGAKIFDFEGLYDNRFPNKSWLGFTHFKKSFGGYEVVYPGTFIKARLPTRSAN